MNKKHLILIVVVITCSLRSYSQNSPFLSWKRLTIRKAFETKSGDDDKPAIASLTFPKGSDNSFLLNAGIGYKFFTNKTGLFNLSAFFVYNYNNLITKKQQNYKLGINAFTNYAIKNIELNGNHNIQYIRDYVDTNYSGLVTTNWSLYSKKSKIKFDGYANADKTFDYFIHLSPGLEYQSVMNTKEKNIATKGYDFRALGTVGFNLLLRTKKDSPTNIYSRHRLVELTVRYDYRQTISSNILNNESQKTLFKAGVNLYPAKTEDFSIGYSYSNGQNPTDGTKKQEFYLLTLQYKFN
jgi:hypothetical protein